MKKALFLIFFAALLTAFGGASTLTRSESRATAAARADTVRIMAMERDSVFLHDSIYIKEWREGDTVYLTKAVTRYRDRDRLLRDTVFRSRADTVSVTDYKWRERETVRVPWPWKAAVAALALAVTALIAAALRKK